MKAAVLVGKEKIDVRDVHQQKPTASEVLVTIKYATICGTVVHIYGGGRKAHDRLHLSPGHRENRFYKKTGCVDLSFIESAVLLFGAGDFFLGFQRAPQQHPSHNGVSHDI